MYHFKKFIQIVFLSLALTTAFINPTMASNIAAIVNNVPITDLDVHNRMKILQWLYQGRSESNYTSTLNAMIDELAMIDFLEKHKLYVSDKEVEESIEDSAKQNGMTAEQLKNNVSNEGISAKSLKQYVKTDLYKRVYITNFILPKINITQEEIEQMKPGIMKEIKSANKTLSRVKLSEILVYGEDKTLAQLKKIQSDIETNLAKSVNFGTLAKRYSEGATASEGGNMGWRNIGDLSGLYKSIIAPLQVGRISPAFINEHVLVFLKLEDAEFTHSASMPAISDEQLENIAKNRKIEEELGTHLTKLRNKAFVNMKQES